MNSNSGFKLYITEKTPFIWLCVYLWIMNSAVIFIRAAFSRLPVFGEFAVPLFNDVIPITLAIFSLFYIVKRTHALEILLYIALVAVYIWSMFNTRFFGAQEYLNQNIFTILGRTFVYIFIGAQMADEKIVSYLYHASKFAIIIGTMTIIMFILGMGDLSDSNMGLAYGMLPHVLLLVGITFKSGKKVDIIYSIIGFMILLVYGSRAPVIFVCGFVLISMLVLKEYKHKILGRIFVAMLFAGIYFILINNISVIQSLLESLGLSTRVLESIGSGSIMESNGREVIYAMALLYIQRNPQGYGLAVDRTFTFSWGESMTYSHNIILEFCLSFGVILGIILFAALVVILMMGFIGAKNQRRLLFLALVFGNGFFRLFVSGSFLSEKSFYLLLGVTIAAIRGHRLEQKMGQQCAFEDKLSILRQGSTD